MNLTDIDPLIRTLIAGCTLVGLLFAGWRWARPAAKSVARDLRAARDAVVGREAVHDSISGIELAPALPGIGVRMESTEQQMGDHNRQMTVLTEAVAKLADSHERLDDHDRRLKALEDGAVERVVARAESAAAWRAVEAVATHGAPETPSIGEN